nr:thiamine-phosphate kinase [Sandaracinobacteroides sayramensis]
MEDGLLATLRALATHKAARGLTDDCAILDWPLGLQLVATHDMLAEGVHFTPHCPPADIGWKLVAVNLSDLAASGARPVGLLLGAGIGDGRGLEWARELLRGVGQAVERYGVPLLGGDTIRSGPASVLSLTALGSVPPGAALERGGASVGDDLWLSGDIGAAGLGLRVALGESFGDADAALLKRYRRPMPRLALGQALRGLASAAMDVSDGLLIDASRLAAASGLRADLRSADIPLSDMVLAAAVPVSELAALGDDYELLFAAHPGRRHEVEDAAAAARTPVHRIGRLQAGAGLLLDGALPPKLGYQHR